MMKVEVEERPADEAKSSKTYVFFDGVVKIDMDEMKVVAGVMVIAVGILFGIIAAFNTPLDTFDDDNDVYSIPPYQICCFGNCANGLPSDVVTVSKPGAVLMGGGSDVEEAFLWQIKNANGGDFVVLRTTGNCGGYDKDGEPLGYNEWVYDLSVSNNMTLNSVTTILFNEAQTTYNDDISSVLTNAEAVFFSGGDQSLDLADWLGTSIQSILKAKTLNITIGGTSAGCAILGGRSIFSSEYGTVYSSTALANPYTPAIGPPSCSQDNSCGLVGPFLELPWLASVLTDTHFVTRNRMGRMLTFLARILRDDMNFGNASVLPASKTHVIGVNEATALLIDYTTGIGTLVGDINGTAYVCHQNEYPEVCENDVPLTFQNISCVQLNATLNDKYDFTTLHSPTGAYYINNITNGFLDTSLAYGPREPNPTINDDDEYQ